MESVGIEIFMPIFVIICGLFEWKEISRFFFIICYTTCIGIAVGDPDIKKGGLASHKQA
jgi:hypothetical protein